MTLMETLYPYLINPMWVSLGLTAICLMIVPFLIKYVRKDLWNNFFHIPYWNIYITNGRNVMKHVILNKDSKQTKLNSIEIKPYTWIIEDDSWINYKAGSLTVLDIKSCVSINIETKESKDIYDAIKKEKSDKEIFKIPLTKYFVMSKNILDDKEKLVGFASKMRANPEFIVNAISLFIFTHQKFTDDIIKTPKTVWEILEENMALILIVFCVCFLAWLIMGHAPNTL